MSPANCVALTRYFFTEAERPSADLDSQLDHAGASVDHLVQRGLLPYQREALVCLASDVEAGYASSPSISFEKSFLLIAVNKGMFQIAAAEFHAFCYVRGKLHPRAWQKRRAEQFLFSRGQLLFE